MPSFWDMRSDLARRGPKTPAPDPAHGATDKVDGRMPDVLSVSQLTTRVRQAIQARLPGQVVVRGEISQWSVGPSGHRYFCLKDARATISCVMWSSDAALLGFVPEVGHELLATGLVDIYGQKSEYQLKCTRLEPFGQGARDVAFQQLKERLEREGLFAPQRKRTLPPYPLRIAIITSAQAAGFQDVLKVLRPYRFLQLFHYPVPVQGEGAAQKIADALGHLGTRHGDIGGIDVVMLVRGGGAVEDLWCFNEESVVRSLATVPIPVITGIGHQTDRTLSDLVADYEAHTPTEAAQVLVRRWKAARDRVDQLGTILRRDIRRLQEHRRKDLASQARHEFFRRPLEMVHRQRRRVDELSFALAGALRRLARATGERLRLSAGALERAHPRQKLLSDRRRLVELERQLFNAWSDLRDTKAARLQEAAREADAALSARMLHAVGTVEDMALRLERVRPDGQLPPLRARLEHLSERLRRAEHARRALVGSHLQALGGKLSALDPTAVLRRGYSITVLKRTGSALRRAADARPGDILVTQTGDGEVQSTVGPSQQGRLFE